ncbi:MAG: CBS domain-containing protein [Bacteroidetes bacterium]|nr:CBS domain-containing protein [Bacteroidota bacterium]
MMNEPLSSIMTTDVITIESTDTLLKAKELLFQNDIQHLPVVEGKKLVGIISYHDLAKINVRIEEYDTILVKNFMTSKIATLEPHEKIGAAAQVFLENLFHGIPIVNERKELIGIVTTHDVLRYEFNKEYPKHKEIWK